MDGELRIEVVKGAASTGPEGASSGRRLGRCHLTARGVNNLVRYWASENGFGPFLKNLKKELGAMADTESW